MRAWLMTIFAMAAWGQRVELPAEGWQAWAQRAELAPKTWREGRALYAEGAANAAESGGWRQVVAVEGGRWYQLRARYEVAGVAREELNVVARFDWLDEAGRRVGQPDYGTRGEASGALELTAPAPEKARRVAVELLLHNAPKARLAWKEVTLEAVAAPAPRKVRVAAVRLRPEDTASAAESVGEFVSYVEKNVEGADLIVLSEGIAMRGTRLSYLETSEPVPGPTTEKLGRLAQAKHAYIVAGIYEREGAVVYNTAVLIGRDGELVGRYRKVYLPREEIEGGLTAGRDYPVFQTDFGKIGLMICWDVQYADPARALAQRGAELIAMPIAGGNPTLGLARAIENQVFLVSSGYSFPTRVVAPDGTILAEAPKEPSVARVEIDLARRYADNWLGHMRDRRRHELRLDVPLQ